MFLLLVQGGASLQNCDQSVSLFSGNYLAPRTDVKLCTSYGTTLDVVWTIWFRYIDTISHAAECYPRLSKRAIVDFDQCVRMTEAAISHGCDIEDSACYNTFRANALFDVLHCMSFDSLTSIKTLEYLLKIGYELEKRNTRGCTPLLEAAMSLRPQAINCLIVFIQHGANIQAIGPEGRNALHCALLGPQLLADWKEMHDSPWHTRIVYNTDRDSSAEDYVRQYHGTSESDVPSIIFDPEYSATISEYWSNVEESMPDHGSINNFHTLDAMTVSSLHQSEGPEYTQCPDYEFVERTIRYPMRVLKTRLRYVLLMLLSHGCDPNAKDNEGYTPDDFAKQNGVWPQWTWALRLAGFEFNVRSKSWVTFSNMEYQV